MSEKLQQAIAAIKAGDKEAGRQFLIDALKADPGNDMAWVWMSAVVDTDALRRECLEEALKYNPSNEPARRGLARLGPRQDESPAREVSVAPAYEPRLAEAPAAPARELRLAEVPEAQPAGDLGFKFRYIPKGGQARGLFTKKGAATEDHLDLDGELLGYDDIVDTTTRGDRLVLVLSPGTRLSAQVSKVLIDSVCLILEVHKVKALELERHIDRICSRREAEKSERRLSGPGKDHLFQTVTCPECQSVVDLSEVRETPYVYCRYCQTVFTPEGEIVTNGTDYQVCSECKMFGRVQGYTEFYFYFLLVVYGFSWKRRFVCDTCAHTMFWKTLLLNLLFVIGIPPSIYIKIKSLVGRDPNLRGLAKANALARKGRLEEALEIYTVLNDNYPEHPGVLMNEGLGLLSQDDVSGASDCFSRALQACGNFLPVLDLARQV